MLISGVTMSCFIWDFANFCAWFNQNIDEMISNEKQTESILKIIQKTRIENCIVRTNKSEMFGFHAGLENFNLTELVRVLSGSLLKAYKGKGLAPWHNFLIIRQIFTDHATTLVELSLSDQGNKIITNRSTTPLLFTDFSNEKEKSAFGK